MMVKKALSFGKHFSELVNVPVQLYDSSENMPVYQNEHFCRKCMYSRCDKCSPHSYGCREAWRWDGKYIYYCPLGLVFCAASMNDAAGQLQGGLIAGPMVMGNIEDTIMELPDEIIEDPVRALAVFSVEQVNHLSEVFSAGVKGTAGQASAGSAAQNHMMKTIYHIKDTCYSGTEHVSYPIEYEKKLQAAILMRNRDEAENLLSEMLSHIYLSNDFDLDHIRYRVSEQIALLSRTTIDAGADVNEVFILNNSYLKELDQCSSTEQISVLMQSILERFFTCSLSFVEMKHTDIVYRAMEYVKSHYAQKISLTDVADYVGLNSAYFSSVFKAEIGTSLMAYINAIRVERSKTLLMDPELTLAEAAALCGFGDQSYFTKIFKKVTGITPKYYRDKRGILVDPGRKE